jgi:hypothetical protein
MGLADTPASWIGRASVRYWRDRLRTSGIYAPLRRAGVRPKALRTGIWLTRAAAGAQDKPKCNGSYQGDGYAMTLSVWKVDGFKGPGGIDFPACRHRSTPGLAKGTDGWNVVYFHNTTIDEAAVKGATAPPTKQTSSATKTA